MLLTSLIRFLPPEVAHRAAINASAALVFASRRAREEGLTVKAFGLTFLNPVGLAAGFDKNAEAVDGLTNLGFGFVEVGTLTPMPQAGNPKPRMFRLVEDGAVINRMGFNNEGYARARRRLMQARRRCVVGVNIGPNRESPNRIADYVLGLETFADLADYFAINISSPNTPGLRNFHARGELEILLETLNAASRQITPRRPLLLKISPDLDDAMLDGVLSLAIQFKIDGLIVSNTTLSRPSSLLSTKAPEAGGLSGRPLFSSSTRLVAKCFLRCGEAIPIIGVGGIEDAQTALIKIEAGAKLIQIYSGLIYRGPGLVREILNGLREHLGLRGVNSLAVISGCRAKEIAENGV